MLITLREYLDTNPATWLKHDDPNANDYDKLRFLFIRNACATALLLNRGVLEPNAYANRQSEYLDETQRFQIDAMVIAYQKIKTIIACHGADLHAPDAVIPYASDITETAIKPACRLSTERDAANYISALLISGDNRPVIPVDKFIKLATPIACADALLTNTARAEPLLHDLTSAIPASVPCGCRYCRYKTAVELFSLPSSERELYMQYHDRLTDKIKAIAQEVAQS